MRAEVASTGDPGSVGFETGKKFTREAMKAGEEERTEGWKTAT